MYAHSDRGKILFSFSLKIRETTANVSTLNIIIFNIFFNLSIITSLDLIITELSQTVHLRWTKTK